MHGALQYDFNVASVTVGSRQLAKAQGAGGRGEGAEGQQLAVGSRQLVRKKRRNEETKKLRR